MLRFGYCQVIDQLHLWSRLVSLNCGTCDVQEIVLLFLIQYRNQTTLNKKL